MDNARQVLVKNGVHIGTQRKVGHMKDYVFKVREDGLAILNVRETLDRLRVAARFIARQDPTDVLVVAAREQAQKPARKFAEAAGLRFKVGRYMPGTMTNPALRYFVEPRLVVTADPYADRQAIKEAHTRGIPVVSLASTNNTVQNVDLVIPCNNKGRRALAAVYWLLANYVLQERGELGDDVTIPEGVADFVAEMPELE